jgi:hypothetical protein
MAQHRSGLGTGNTQVESSSNHSKEGWRQLPQFLTHSPVRAGITELLGLAARCAAVTIILAQMSSQIRTRCECARATI